MTQQTRHNGQIPAILLTAALLIPPGSALSSDDPLPSLTGPARFVESQAPTSCRRRVGASHQTKPVDPNGTLLTSTLVYQPPSRGAPGEKVGGGLRGSHNLPTPVTLAPAHLAYTASAQPSLFWHINWIPAPDSQLVLTLTDELNVKPLAEIALKPPKSSGIQRVRLSNYGTHLAPGIEYEWSIALVVDPEQRSKDISSSGFIQHVPEPAELKTRGRSIQSYLALGLWYDALTQVSDELEERPGDPALGKIRNVFFRQAGLGNAVE